MNTDKTQHPNGARSSRIRAGDRDQRVRLAEQERIATGMGQIVIREVFSIGLVLQSCASTRDTAVAERLQGVVAQLDDLIADVRRIVFDQAVKATEPMHAASVEHNGSPRPGAAVAVLDLSGQARTALDGVDATPSLALSPKGVCRPVVVR